MHCFAIGLPRKQLAQVISGAGERWVADLERSLVWQRAAYSQDLPVRQARYPHDLLVRPKAGCRQDLLLGVNGDVGCYPPNEERKELYRGTNRISRNK
jgi:hypothetical protein